LLFGLLSRLTGCRWPSALVAFWFGLHPSHVESVAWVAERKDVLSTLFFLLTLWAYGRYGEKAEGGRQKAEASPQPSTLNSRPSTLYYALALVFFALGLMSKPMLVTLPFVLLLLDYWPLRRFRPSTINQTPSTFWPLLREKLPFFLLALLSCGATLWAQTSAGSVISMEAFPFANRSANALLSCWRYVQKAIWPSPLAVFYPYGGPAPAWLVLGAGVALLVVTAATIRARKRPYLALGWLWFVGTLVPVIGLVQVGTQAMADRYLYIPSIGLFILAALA
jgi:hypothetical protein